MTGSKARTLRALGIARMAAGAAIFVMPGVAGWLFAGQSGRTAAVSIFARGFAARDIAIGAGLTASADEAGAARRWLAAATAADVADALGVLLTFRHLPASHRWAALTASLVPAAVEGWALRALLEDQAAHH